MLSTRSYFSRSQTDRIQKKTHGPRASDMPVVLNLRLKYVQKFKISAFEKKVHMTCTEPQKTDMEFENECLQEDVPFCWKLSF